MPWSDPFGVVENSSPHYQDPTQEVASQPVASGNRSDISSTSPEHARSFKRDLATVTASNPGGRDYEHVIASVQLLPGLAYWQIDRIRLEFLRLRLLLCLLAMLRVAGEAVRNGVR